MRVTVCFDVDGTLETSAGPVTVARLDELRQAGASVVVVSPSALRPHGFDERIDGPSRADNLRAAATDWPADLLIYVSDNSDQAEAAAAGFCYVDRNDFR